MSLSLIRSLLVATQLREATLTTQAVRSSAHRPFCSGNPKGQQQPSWRGGAWPCWPSAASQRPKPLGQPEKNKDKDAPVAADPSSGDTDFSKLNDMVKNLQQAGAAGGAGGEDMFAGMGDMWESLMDSPEMEEMLANPELLKATIKNNPLINAIPGASEQVEALLQSDAFNDPAQLKQAMRQGVDAMKAVGSEFGVAARRSDEIGAAEPGSLQGPDGGHDVAIGRRSRAGAGADGGREGSVGRLRRPGAARGVVEAAGHGSTGGSRGHEAPDGRAPEDDGRRPGAGDGGGVVKSWRYRVSSPEPPRLLGRPSTPTSTPTRPGRRRVVASGDAGPPAGAAGASGWTLFEEPQGSLPRQIQNNEMKRTGPPVRHQPVKQIQ